MQRSRSGLPRSGLPRSGLLGTRYAELARNTIDYWMLPDAASLSQHGVLEAIETAPALPESSLRIYLHVPYCAQRCRFCAFSGGNSLDWREAERYAELLVRQLHDLWGRSAMRGQPIRSINIGGGSPDLLGLSIDRVLDAVRGLPGFDPDETEIAVEFTLSTVKPAFIERLVAHQVTKVSFGVQSLNPEVRGYMRQPKSLGHLDRALDWIGGRIPVVNADLITGLPGQTRAGVAADLEALMADPRITALSSYLLTSGAAPSLLAGIEKGQIPAPPPSLDQSLMRLETYGAFLRGGWVRRGTNTYVDPARIDARILTRLAGDECLGASQYETHLIAVGPQAVSSLPGVRAENHVDVASWSAAVERGEAPFYLAKCAIRHQHDMALWSFPLRWEGLPRARFEAMQPMLDERQLRTFAAFEREGLIVVEPERYRLSLLGEVFMGHLVRDLKDDGARCAVDDYVAAGERLGRAVARGELPDDNTTNDRQRPWARAGLEIL